MFSRARLRLTLLYVLQLGGSLALVAGAIFVLGVREARRSDDQELRLNAEYVAGTALRRPPGDPGAFVRGRAFDNGAPTEGESRPPRGERGPGLESQGTLTYLLPVVGGQLGQAPASSVSGLPDTRAAAEALAEGRGVYRTVSLEDGAVRVYSAPVLREGRPVAVVQSARSRYFLESTVTRLLVVVLGAGA